MPQLMMLTQKKKGRWFQLDYKWRNYDFLLAASVLALSLIGVVAITSADPSLTMKRIGGIAAFALVMTVLSLINYRFIMKFWWLCYLVNLVLLLGVRLFGYTSHGATRWLRFGNLSLQPSELSKILLILFFAQFIMNYRDKIKPYIFVPLCGVLLLPPLYLVYKQPDLSTSIMLLVIFAVVMYVGGLDIRVVAAALIILIPFTIFMIYSAAAWETHPFLDTFQQQRIRAWLRPEDYATSDAYQTLNSMMAIGSGQMTGKGINTNEITSVLNSGYISESETDLSFTVIGEETGFIGGCVVISLILLISIKCMVIAGRARDPAGRIIAASVGAWIGFQAFLNIGVATGVVPNTGSPLPFVSSGLTALLSTFSSIGIVLNIGLQAKRRY